MLHFIVEDFSYGKFGWESKTALSTKLYMCNANFMTKWMIKVVR